MEKEIKILMVDDETDFTQPMAFWFRSKGYNVLVASNGKEGLEIIKKENPDIVFLDLNMPEMDGLETLKKLREINETLPVVVISAYADPQKMKEMQPYKISGVFYKGDDFERGLTLLESVLRTHRQLHSEEGETHTTE